MKFYRIHALVCAGTQCLAAGGNSFKNALEDEIKKHDLTNEVIVVETGCMGSCQLGPRMVVYPEGIMYTKLKPEDGKEIVEEHFIKGVPVRRLSWEQEGKQFLTLEETPFFSKQTRIVLRNCGFINPEDITEYIAQGGYESLGKALTSMSSADVIKIIKDSLLRGRGGAGFPTGLKWELAKKQTSDIKYIICNADEGDPGAYMNRSVLEGDPHSVLEGMTIAGYAVGAQKGFIYIRAEYPLAVKRLQIAIKQAKEIGLLGKNILGTNFSFDIELRIGAGAFVCGEETALINSTEGKRGEPRKKPPYPIEIGLFGRPTVINNVETLANVPIIIEKGANFFKQIGTEKSPGTKAFSLVGKVNIAGLIEVPLGTSLRTIVFDIGGGIPEGHTFKAAQTGGPSGGVIPANYIDIPMDYENLPQLGAIMGSGGLIVMDETSCMVDVAKFFLKFTVDESCGKCVPCREGTRQMLNILEKITRGGGTMKDLDLLEKLGNVIKSTSLCGLGQTAPNPVLSTLRHFRDEYISHVKDKKCPAKVCPMN
ncbi:NADH dehydrogenase (quinone) [Thermodesulfobium narugense DSM 14796]|uniref:NADH dehydrogenase (Quinone) n=1 Tax=Thermodesulfobium narugense DSM 14796 TaxID=747365 RepID=M1E7X8_9BACT|nr:NuoF family protein [Thermodesulfobium narugense]AEE14670.1 NADH dehydrogenase (quinone) [Thermodesulfobium narugense DSM 14796]